MRGALRIHTSTFSTDSWRDAAVDHRNSALRWPRGVVQDVGGLRREGTYHTHS